jgi:hypothetical protein
MISPDMSASAYKSSPLGFKTGLSAIDPNIHSSHDLSRPEAKRSRDKLANLNIRKWTL